MTFDSFEEFYPYYISQHSRRGTRMVHFFGTLAGAGIAVNAVVRGPRRSLLLAPVVGYGAAWLSHFLIEKNKPASWGYTLYSFQGDWKMLSDIARGRDAQLQQLADEYKASHDIA